MLTGYVFERIVFRHLWVGVLQVLIRLKASDAEAGGQFACRSPESYCIDPRFNLCAVFTGLVPSPRLSAAGVNFYDDHYRNGREYRGAIGCRDFPGSPVRQGYA